MRSPYAPACIIVALLCAATLGVEWHNRVSAAGGSISRPARVIDGDTIIIGGRYIRLQGLDAEEMSMANGPKARAVMIDVVGNQIIACKPDGTRSYNRIVATCLLPDGSDISRELVRRGWALDCQRYSHGRYHNDEPVGIRQKLSQAGYC